MPGPSPQRLEGTGKRALNSLAGCGTASESKEHGPAPPLRLARWQAMQLPRYLALDQGVGWMPDSGPRQGSRERLLRKRHGCTGSWWGSCSRVGLWSRSSHQHHVQILAASPSLLSTFNFPGQRPTPVSALTPHRAISSCQLLQPLHPLLPRAFAQADERLANGRAPVRWHFPANALGG